MLRFAGRMVWFPISYTLLLLPSGIAGLSAARGHPVSPGAEVFVGVTYNLIGLTTVLLLHTTRHLYPSSADLSNIPGFETKRSNHAFVRLMETGGVTPFDLCNVRGGGGGRRGSGHLHYFDHLELFNHLDDLEYCLVVFTDPADSETGGDVSVLCSGDGIEGVEMGVEGVKMEEQGEDGKGGLNERHPNESKAKNIILYPMSYYVLELEYVDKDYSKRDVNVDDTDREIPTEILRDPDRERV
ncbi:hypothetical protein GG344DRAFT_71501 [Lentinula edodes]|nr:hypothetical protein GG344DRAFT_71501 [Lentinula edodes]